MRDELDGNMLVGIVMVAYLVMAIAAPWLLFWIVVLTVFIPWTRIGRLLLGLCGVIKAAFSREHILETILFVVTVMAIPILTAIAVWLDKAINATS